MDKYLLFIWSMAAIGYFYGIGAGARYLVEGLTGGKDSAALSTELAETLLWAQHRLFSRA
jgi:hypothetical protein